MRYDSLVSGLLDEKLLRKNKRKCTPAPAQCDLPSVTLPFSLSRCLSSRLTTFTISAQWKTQHTSRICCLRHQFNLKTFSAILPPSHTHTHTQATSFHLSPSPSLLPAHRGRHHSCLSPRLCFIALRFGATKIVAYFAARPVN